MKTLIVILSVLSLNANAAGVKCYKDNKGSCQDGPSATQMAVTTSSAPSQTDPTCCTNTFAKEVDLTANTNDATAAQNPSIPTSVLHE